MTSAPPGQQVQTGGKAGGLRKVRGGIGSPKSGPSQPGLLGTCLLWHGCGGNLLGKLDVFPSKAGSCSKGEKVG